MYNVSLYEEGRFCTNIGDPVSSPLEAVGRIRAKVRSLNYTALTDYIGVKFDRAGTACALLVTDQSNYPIRTSKKLEG